MKEENTYTEVTRIKTTEQTDKEKRKTIPILLILFFIILVIIFLIILYFSKTKHDDISNETDTGSIQNQEEDNTNTEPEDTQITDETPACAPVYTGGVIDSHTSTETTWSYYFSEATKESVLEYVENLKGNGWSAISEKTIANTSFWDLQKENCFVSLRYHSTDSGVILEIKEEAN